MQTGSVRGRGEPFYAMEIMGAAGDPTTLNDAFDRLVTYLS